MKSPLESLDYLESSSDSEPLILPVPINVSHITAARAYLSEVKGSRYAPISLSQEIELAKRKKKGDRVAAEELVEHNLRFVVGVAMSMRVRGRKVGLNLMDLISAGNTGLLESAGRYDGKYKCKLITYAQQNIREKMRRAIRWERSGVDLPRRAREDEISTLSLNDSVHESEDSDKTTYQDKLTYPNEPLPIDNLMTREVVGRIERILLNRDHLFTKRERFILVNRLEIGGRGKKTYVELARELRVPRSSIAQMYDRGIEKLKKRYLSIFYNPQNLL